MKTFPLSLILILKNDPLIHTNVGTNEYMNIWVPLIGDESLICQKKKGNVYNAHAVVIIRGNFVVEHVPENICDSF